LKPLVAFLVVVVDVVVVVAVAVVVVFDVVGNIPKLIE